MVLLGALTFPDNHDSPPWAHVGIKTLLILVVFDLGVATVVARLKAETGKVLFNHRLLSAVVKSGCLVIYSIP